VDVDSDRVDEAAAVPGGPTAGDTPERILMRATLDADLQAALDALPDAFRQAVWLRDVEEFSYAEIAEMLDIPIGTVMSRISRGRRLLFERLGPTRSPAPLHAGSGR
jgi:RNA polymerase sigma-70 factor (ECF subfamily)